MAYKYIESGFFEEADKELKMAKEAKESAHANLHAAAAKLAEESEREERDWDKALVAGAKQRLFLRKLAVHRFEGKVGFSGKWTLNGIDGLLEVHGAKVVGKWDGESEVWCLTGEVRGGAIEGKLEKKGKNKVFWLAGDVEYQVFGFAEGRTLNFMLLADHEIEYLSATAAMN